MAQESGRSAVTEEQPWTVRRIIDATTEFLKKQGCDTPRLDTEILLAHTRGCKRIDLYTRYEEVLTDEQRTAMRELVRRRAKAEPVAYLVGHREFFGLSFRVTSDVLIPRPDTETLVVELLALAKPLPSPRIADVGTGSGCIAVTAAKHLPNANVTAIDLSEPALAVARENAQRHKMEERVRFVHGNLFAGLEANERFDLIASNPPYIAEHEMDTLQADVRLHEPHSALVAGADGLDVVRRLVAEAPDHLTPNGHLLMEIAPEQAAAVTDLLTSSGRYRNVRVIKDLSGAERVVSAQVNG